MPPPTPGQACMATAPSSCVRLGALQTPGAGVTIRLSVHIQKLRGVILESTFHLATSPADWCGFHKFTGFLDPVTP